jgi:hypothetical protein
MDADTNKAAVAFLILMGSVGVVEVIFASLDKIKGTLSEPIASHAAGIFIGIILAIGLLVIANAPQKPAPPSMAEIVGNES